MNTLGQAKPTFKQGAMPYRSAVKIQGRSFSCLSLTLEVRRVYEAVASLCRAQCASSVARPSVVIASRDSLGFVWALPDASFRHPRYEVMRDVKQKAVGWEGFGRPLPLFFFLDLLGRGGGGLGSGQGWLAS